GLALAYHPGARLVFADGTPDILAYPRDRGAWGRLCRLLTRGNLRAQKGECILYRDDLLEHIDGLELIVMETSTWELASPPLLRKPPSTPASTDLPASMQAGPKSGLRLVASAEKKASANHLLALLRDAAQARARLAALSLYRRTDTARPRRPASIPHQAGVPPIADNDVFQPPPAGQELQDVLSCLREHVTIGPAGRPLAVNPEPYPKAPAEMA